MDGLEASHSGGLRDHEVPWGRPRTLGKRRAKGFLAKTLSRLKIRSRVEYCPDVAWPDSRPDAEVPAIACVISTRNRRAVLAETLCALEKAGYPRLEVVVVDNGSTDGTLELLRESFPWVRQITQRENCPLRGYNLGVARASSPYVFLMDDDAAPRPGVLEDMVRILEAHPGLAVAAANVVSPDGESEWGPEGNTERTDRWWNLIGCGFLIRREVWEEIGGYEESFRLYYNDLDLALAILASGRRLVYDPQWLVVHRRAAGTCSPFVKHQMMLRNFPRICRRYLPRGLAFRCALGHGLIVLRRTPLRERGRATISFLRGLLGSWPRRLRRLPVWVEEEWRRRFAVPDCLFPWRGSRSSFSGLDSVLSYIRCVSESAWKPGEVEIRVRKGLPPLRVPRVAAAIVTHNKQAAVLRLLERLRDEGVPAFVLANDCTDGTVEAVQARHPEVSLLTSAHNLGGTGGFNAALLAALSSGAPYVVLIDDDAWPEEGCLSRLADFLDAHPECPFAAPAIYLADHPDVLQETGGRVDFRSRQPVEALHRFMTRPPTERPFAVDYASACLLMVRASVILQTGGMDWDWFLFFDDVDWCLKLSQATGGRGACVPSARAFHEFPWAKAFTPQRLYYLTRNTLRLLARWGPPGLAPRALRTALQRAWRSRLVAWAAGDWEIGASLRKALDDARSGRGGPWQRPSPFPMGRRRLADECLPQAGIRRVLLDFRIEEGVGEAGRRLRTRLPHASLDALAEPSRAEFLQRFGWFRHVHERERRAFGRLRQFLALRGEGYDLVVSDACFDPRGPLAMTGRRAAFYHQGELWEADCRPWKTLAVAALSPVLARAAALFSAWAYQRRPTEGRPPPEAESVLKVIGVDPSLGGPRERHWTVPFHRGAVGLPSSRQSRGAQKSNGGLRRRAVAGVAKHLPFPWSGQADPGGYEQWWRSRTVAAMKGEYLGPVPRKGSPLFSVVMPVCDPPLPWLRAAIRSVRRQTFPDWELVVVDDASRQFVVRAWLRLQRLLDSRLRLRCCRTRGGISGATNEAAAQARAPYLVFLDHDDLLDPLALDAFAAALAKMEADGRGDRDVVLYADEDRFDETGTLFYPGFKPAFSPERLLATNYIHHPVVISRRLFEQLGGCRSEYDGSQDHDLLLRAAEAGAQFLHVPDVLYHMRYHAGSLVARPEAKPQAHQRDLALIEAAFRRWGIDVSVVPLPGRPGLHRVERRLRVFPKVTVLWIRDPSGAEPQVWKGAGWEHLSGHPTMTPAAQINALARAADGELLLVMEAGLRVDPEAVRNGLVPQGVRPEIGLVSGQITHSDETVCTCGLVLGVAGATGRWHHGCPSDGPSYAGWLEIAHEVSAVPWLFLLVRRSLFEEIGGLDEGFFQQGFDVDLALRLSHQKSVRHLVVPWVRARRPFRCPAGHLELWPEEDVVRLWLKWGHVLRRDDPYFNPHFSRLGEGVHFVDRTEADLRARGVFMAYDRPTALALVRRFGRQLTLRRAEAPRPQDRIG